MAKAPQTPPPSTPAPAAGAAQTEKLLYGIFALLAVGIGVAIYLVRHKLHITLDPTYISSCNLGGAVNCDAVNVSDWSEIKGLPISLFAIPTYAVMGYLTWLKLRGLKDRAQADVGDKALDAVAGIGLMTSLYSLALAMYSSVVVEHYCVYCISLYVVNVGATALAVQAGPKTVGNAIQRALNLLISFKEPVPVALGITIIAGGAAWYGYDMKKAAMEANYKALIDKEMAGGGGEVKDPKIAGAVDPGSPSGGGSAPVQQPKPAAGLKEVKVGNYSMFVGGKKTQEDGWTYVQFPILPDDQIYGNPDAKVTVVKIADFECAYCRYLTMTMEPLKAKYKDKVRFVMKNFPMNPSCNRFMAGYDKHPNACNGALAAVCAGQQGKFWDMHDKLYANQPKLDQAANKTYAQELGLDLAKFDACVADPKTMERIKQDIDMAYAVGIYGTPKTYINGRLVTGSATTAILEYHIEKALENPDAGPPGGEVVAAGPRPDGSHMLQAKTAKGAFFIDPYEAAITKDGKAVTLPDVEPAQASWAEADEACKKAGKRLCTEEEWVSACTGLPAVDDNTNQQFADDKVEGKMYPYGDLYDAGQCVDAEDKYKGKAQKTGSKAACRTPGGIFDLAGNIGEWSGVSKETAGLMGGHMSSGERAACNQRSSSFAPGYKNMTTGFRCCADADVAQGKVSASDLKTADGDLMGKPVPEFSAKDTDGKDIATAQFKGKVTLINFFASWCGPCKKEFPELINLYKEHKDKGFQVVSIGVDREGARSLEFAKGFETPWGIIQDEENDLMGKFGVYSMPATFIVDRQGVIRYFDTGFKPEEQLEKLRNGVKSLL